MRKFILSTLAATAFAISVLAQAPQGFKYQAVIRDAAGNILNNQAVGMQMTIQQGSIGGTTIYQETFSGTTNAYGLMNLEIGSGIVISGDFTTIDWSNGPYFIETAVDVAGGTSYSVMGTSQLMSVPYALHANTAENVVNDAVDDADNDPTNEIETWATLSGIPNMILTMQNGEQYVGASGGLELVIVSVTFPTSSTKNPEEDIIPLPLNKIFGLPLEPPTSNDAPKKPKLDTTALDSNVSASFMFEAVTLPSLSTKNPEEDTSPLADIITLGVS